MNASELPEIIGMGEACQLSGRTARTIRRWVTDGRLTDLRPDGDRVSPLRLRTTDLRALLTELAPDKRPAPGAGRTRQGAPTAAPAPAPPAAAPELVAELRARVADLQGAVEDARRERDRQAERMAQVEAERLTLVQDLAEARAAREAVERETAGFGGVRGLLTAAAETAAERDEARRRAAAEHERSRRLATAAQLPWYRRRDRRRILAECRVG